MLSVCPAYTFAWNDKSVRSYLLHVLGNVLVVSVLSLVFRGSLADILKMILQVSIIVSGLYG